MSHGEMSQIAAAIKAGSQARLRAAMLTNLVSVIMPASTGALINNSSANPDAGKRLITSNKIC